MSESSVRSSIFSSARSLSGNLRRLKSAYGAITYSACPPIQPPRSTYPKAPPAPFPLTFKQIPVLPSRQLRQRPHAMLKGTDTRSPTFKNSTSRPFSMISPVISCPRTIPAGAVVRPRTICWSLPQMLVLTSLRITPCSHLRDPSANFGKSIDWTSTFPGPTYTTPRLFAIFVPSDWNKVRTPLMAWSPAHRQTPNIPSPVEFPAGHHHPPIFSSLVESSECSFPCEPRYRRLPSVRPCGPPLTSGTSTPSAVARSI